MNFLQTFVAICIDSTNRVDCLKISQINVMQVNLIVDCLVLLRLSPQMFNRAAMNLILYRAQQLYMTNLHRRQIRGLR